MIFNWQQYGNEIIAGGNIERTYTRKPHKKPDPTMKSDYDRMYYLKKKAEKQNKQ